MTLRLGQKLRRWGLGKARSSTSCTGNERSAVEAWRKGIAQGAGDNGWTRRPQRISRSAWLTKAGRPAILIVSLLRAYTILGRHYEGSHGSEEVRAGTEESLPVLHEGRLSAAGVCRLQGRAGAEKALHQP